jgi:hypothetical protein
VSDSKDLTVSANGAALERNVAEEQLEVIERISNKHHATVEAADLWSLPDEELLKLPARTRNIALAARQNRNEAPMGLGMAHDFVIAREKRKLQEKSTTINIHAQDGSQVGVVLPPRPAPPKEVDVVVVDANRLKPPEDREA